MDKLKWTKGVAGKLKPGVYLRLSPQGVDLFQSGEGIEQYVWYPVKDCFICGPLDIADPDPELELPEGWSKKWDGPTVMPFCVVVVRGGLGGIAGAENDEVRVASFRDRARCVLAVNAAVKALEEQK
jgi:hypothetical protein